MRALSRALRHRRMDQPRARRTDARARFLPTRYSHLMAHPSLQMVSQTRPTPRPTNTHSTLTSALCAWSVNPRTKMKMVKKTSAFRMAGRIRLHLALLAHIPPLLRLHPTIPSHLHRTIPRPMSLANIPGTKVIPMGQVQTTWTTSSRPLVRHSLISASIQQTSPRQQSSPLQMNQNRRGRPVSMDMERDLRLEEAR